MNTLLKKPNKRYLFLNPSDVLEHNINQLPPQLRNRIYILCMRKFWRNYIPLTQKVPTWYKSNISQKKMIFHAQQNNIHFLHIDSNTLDEYRKYIVGCQCHFCKYIVSKEHREEEQQNNIESIHYFNKIIPFTESKWNDLLEYIYDPETTDIMN